MHVVAMGCGLANAAEVAYADGLDLERAKVGIGLPAACAIAPTATAAPSLRWSTDFRWIG